MFVIVYLFSCLGHYISEDMFYIWWTIIIWEIGGGGQVFFCPGTDKFSWWPCIYVTMQNKGHK